MSLQTYTSVCRTCLIENGNMKSVFGVETFMEQSWQLCDILMSCTSVQVFKGDGLPEQVCVNCAQEINRVFLFRKLCEKSDATLRNCFRTLLPVPSDNVDLNTNFLNIDDNKLLDSSLIIKNDIFTQLKDEDDKKLDDNDIPPEVCEATDESEDDTFERKKKVRKKNIIEHKKKTYPCKHCQTICLGLGQYRRHMGEAHSQMYKCDICGKECRTEAVLTRHLQAHNENRRLVENTSKPFRNKTGIIKKRNLPRTCNICNKTFRFHSNLERHKLIHTGEKPYLCNVCGKGFAQLSYLKIHSFIHTGEKPYQCKMCDKSFAAPGTLMTHIRTHTGERPHVCKICGKDFPQSGYLSAHIRTHTGEKPVECKVCNRRFNQSGRLIIHMRIHSGEKPYNCVECGRSFAVKGTLKKHIRTHTGERPYICSVCGQAFAQSGTLATHMKVHKPK